jgi:polyhydroxyalkanoate synthesis repressor PhaR
MTDTNHLDAPSQAPAQPPVVVKKYANRRLYNTETSSYITLDNLADMVRAGRDFVVYDARTGDDITRGVLTQIIVEEENKGRALLPTTFLRQLIGFYGDSLGGVVPRYLEQTMSTIARQQEQMRDAMKTTMGTLLPPGLEEMRRQNVAMMERAMSLFTPFYRPTDAEVSEAGPAPSVTDELEALKREVEDLRAQLAARPELRPLRKA